ncbi:MAG: acyl-CoA thioesterase [Thermodesulfobacteriota bacterium]|nr:acyl-CoA thioesterase [Thermodesulfobacteriota bacterium]
MKGKLSKESSVTVSQVIQPHDVNPAGKVDGGVIMKYIDNAASVVAVRHAGKEVVTTEIDQLNFYNPVYLGNLLTLKARLNYAGKTSMEIGVRVEAENLITGRITHIASAYLTFVALTPTGKPDEVPPLILLSDDENRRSDEAVERRKRRLEAREKEIDRQKHWTASQQKK